MEKHSKSESKDVVDLNQWLLVEEAVGLLVSQSTPRSGAHLYAKAKKKDFKTRDIKGRCCLWRPDVEKYAQEIKKDGKSCN